MFVGGFTWFPNLDAIHFFCKDILPKLVKVVPDVHLTVIGNSPDTPVVHEIARHPNVHLAGASHDIRPYVDEAAASHRAAAAGAARALKILDALSMSKAIISPRSAARGWRSKMGTIITADT